ncbi:MBL fold metallo-hydrolase [archaeon]|nr:MBL fold metallo-hydrolase [archaeon]
MPGVLCWHLSCFRSFTGLSLQHGAERYLRTVLTLSQISSAAFALLSYVVTDSDTGECFIIDPPSDIATRIDLAALNLKAVINTHIHPDHTMGNHVFSGKVPIFAHMEEGRLFQRITNSSLAAVFTARIPPKISFTLTEGEKLMLGRESIEVIHTPGHSPGSICLTWQGNLISGDTIFVEGFGRTDIPGGNTGAIIKSINRLLSLPGTTKVWPGHSYGGKLCATIDKIRPVLNRYLQIIH